MMTESRLPTPPDMDTPDNAPSFEQVLARIRELVGRLESGELTLEESVRTYQEGARLIEQCRRMIDEAELRIMQLETTQDTP